MIEGFTVLHEEDALPRWDVPELLATLYGGAIGLEEPCVVANFVESLDGVVAVPRLPRSHALLGDEILGISKLTRLVRMYARRFTVQERLAEEIADGLRELAGARGVAVRLEAAHMCTAMRGVEEDGSLTVTTVWRGVYDEDQSLRSEFLTLTR